MTRTDFRLPVAVAALMRGYPRSWYIAGGWAIDLYLNRRTREHDDIEVATLRGDQQELRSHLADWEFRKALPGGRGLEHWEAGEWLEPPVHEIHARRQVGEPTSLEILLNETEGDVWKYRRNPAVTRDLTDIGITSRHNIPFLRPEIVLLYKAKVPRATDGEDLHNVLESLEPGARSWLRRAVGICHPDHPWLGEL